MDNKNIIYFFSLTKRHYLYLFFIFIVISFTNCIIEIPIQAIKVNGGWKHKNIMPEEPDENSIHLKNKTILMSEGDAILNTNYLFIGTVKIGSQGQQFNLILDTGSYIVWVAKYGSIDEYKIVNHFYPTSSTTCTATGNEFEQKYETGYCKGYYYKDYFNYINNKNFYIQFGVADKTQLNVDKGDGIIGLAHYYPDESLSFIHMLKKAGITNSISFSMKLDYKKKAGSLYIGRHDDFSDAITCPLLTFQGMSNIYWVCEISGFGLRNAQHEISSSRSFNNIIFDTGTNFILLPMQYYEDIKDSLKVFGCGSRKTDKYLSIYCSVSNTDDLPNLTLKINGNTLIIPRNNLFSRSNISPTTYNSEICFIKSNLYIIGTPFFLSFHTLFDKENEQLRFYPLEGDYLEKGTSVFSIIAIVVVITLLVLLFGCIIYRFIKWRRARASENFPSSNYNNYNFI